MGENLFSDVEASRGILEHQQLMGDAQDLARQLLGDDRKTPLLWVLYLRRAASLIECDYRGAFATRLAGGPSVEELRGAETE